MRFNQFKIGAVLSYLNLFVSIAVTFIYTPMVIRLLGQSEYGLYAMIGSLSAYLSIMDMGLGNAIIRYTARNRGLGSLEKQPNLNSLFLVLYSIIGMLSVLVGWILYDSIEFLFGEGLQYNEISTLKLMLIIVVFNFAISFPLAIFGAYMEAHEQFVVIKTISIIRTILIPTITLSFLYFNQSSVVMVLIATIVNILCLIFNVYYCFHKLQIKFKFNKLDFNVLKEILGYSFFIFLAIIVDQLYWNTGQIVLGIINGTAVVAVFAIAIQIVRVYLQFSTALSGLFFPKISIMVAKEASPEDFTEMLIKFGRIQYVIIALILSGFTLYGYEFIGFWAGSDYLEAYYMVLLIMIPITIPLIQNVGLAILQAKNLQKFRSLVLIFIALFNLLLSILLAKKMGGIGVAFSVGISYIIGNIIIMNIYYYKKLKLNIPKFWKNITKLTVPVFISFLSGLTIKYLFDLNNAFQLTLSIFCYSIIYIVAMWFLGLNRYEKSLVNNILRKVINVRK